MWKIKRYTVYRRVKRLTSHVVLTLIPKQIRFLGPLTRQAVAWTYPVIRLPTKDHPAFCIIRPRVKWIMERCFVWQATWLEDKLYPVFIMSYQQVGDQ